MALNASATQAVAEFACRHDLSQAPDELPRRATRAVMDTLAVTIAGAHEDCFRILARTLPVTPGEATLLPTGERTTAAQAALLNGTAGHALDYDYVRHWLERIDGPERRRVERFERVVASRGRDLGA